MRRILFLAATLFLFSSHAQITEDFSDGDFADGTPLTWVVSQTSGGDDFVISSGEVQSNGPSATSALYLSTDLGIDFLNNDVVWTFKARYTTASPTSGNRIEIYLISNIEDVTSTPSGYYIGMGETGSTDGIDLFKTGSSTAIINDDNDLVGSGIDIHVRVTRTSTGMWTLEADATGGDTFSEIGTVTDTDFTSGDFFGFYVVHSSSRNQDYFFDDFTVTTTPVADTDPPIIQSATAISDTEVDVQFNEDVDATTAQTISNYVIAGGISVNSAVLDTDNSLVHLTTSALTNGETYTLTVNNIQDTNGNTIVADSEESFEYLVFEEAVAFDVVINEFMADPNPVITTLPDAEYVELYNRSEKYFNLENWTLDGQALLVFTLAPDEYVIIVEDDDETLFSAFTDVISITTLSLNNSSEDNITLMDDNASTIHSISFEGSEEGISTELINPNGPDYSANNYGSSTDPDGGTPGSQNSIFDDTPDTTAPSISAISVVSATELDVTFSETVEEASAETTTNYAIDGITLSTAILDDTNNTLVHLTVSTLPSGESQTLTVNGVEDLSGNAISNATIDFEYIETEEAEVNDVVINEFLASPSAESGIPNAEFVELYNRSSKFIDLEGWTLSDAAGISSAMAQAILRPGEYVILTETDNGSLFESYGDVLEVNGFPSLNNGGDSVIIQNSLATIIHETAYTGSSSGISTELINPNGPDYSANNYGSSTDPDGGTPGSQNSIFDDTPDTTAPSISAISVVSATELDVTFSETVEEASAETTTNYAIDGITLSTAILDDTNNTLVHLTVSTLPSGESQTLTVNGVEDLSGNAISNATIDFEYIETEEAEVNDVVINEFLASPSAESGIPNAEFVELYNRSSKFIDLEGWTLSDAAGISSAMAQAILRPGEYVILTETDNGSLFESYGDVLEVNGFPSLNNGGDSVIIQNSLATIIHETAYTGSSSGISTELINPNGPDYSANNYGPSTDPDGGTPGAQNSIFDDTPDTTAPSISAISVVSATELDVTFSETVEEASAETTTNYAIDGISLSTAILDDTNNTLVHLTVSTLPSGESQTLTVNGVEDLSGNTASNATVQFEYIETEEAEVNDVVINEFLASPSAESGIPNAEFVELYNRSSKFIDLEGWTLSDAAGSSSAMPQAVLRPGEYVILTETDNGSLFESYGDVLEVNGFPSLNNGGDSVIIQNSLATIIHETAYTSSSSGVSTELINPNGPDYSANNYSSSTDPDGSTPGSQNSIFDDTPDTTAPSISAISVVSATELDVIFSETVEEASAETTTNYAIDGISLSTAILDDTNNTLVHLTVSTLPSGESQTLTVNGVEDLSGNTASNATVQFEYIETEEAEVNDVVINEFLASPSAESGIPNAEFVELYNRSSKFIDLEGWTLSDAAGSSSAMPQAVLRPGEYVILTETDNGSLFESYGDVLEVNGFPSLNNGGDSVIIQNSLATIIHETAYTSSSSSVSTELINPNGPDYSANNYGSSTDPDGGTPGAQNSIFDDTPDTTAPAIVSISVISQTELDVTFSETVEEASAETTTNYAIDGISVSTATLDETNNTLVHLTVSTLPSGESQTLIVNGVEDLSGNAASNEIIVFKYLFTQSPEPLDVVINEYFPDPTPSKGLPEAEFVELFNRSEKNLELLKWTIDGSTLSSFVLEPDSYVIVCDDSTIDLFAAFENVIAVSSLSLSNSESQIILNDSTGSQIQAVEYFESGEGISSELINPDDPCISGASYRLSVDEAGGTPGRRNSVFDPTPDTEQPSVTSYTYGTNLVVSFSEVMDGNSLLNGTYSVSDGLLIDEVSVNGDFPSSIEVSFDQPIEEGRVYEFTLSEVQDCPGNTITETTISFGIGRSPTFNELIITEIMADPDPPFLFPEREYIELYNASEEIISLENVALSDNSESALFSSINLNPGEYLAITTTTGASEFNSEVAIIGLTGFPSLSNDGEQLLLTHNDNLIFSVFYSKDWHSSLENEIGGVSLEMKDVSNPCGGAENWSSSMDSSKGTPGNINSIIEEVPDSFPPKLLSALALANDTIKVEFSEQIDPTLQTVVFDTEPALEVSESLIKTAFPNEVFLVLSEPMIPNNLYVLNVTSIADCKGNVSDKIQVSFALPAQAELDEIKLSEVLFNPRTNGVDFVEIYNSSDQFLSLKNWQIGTLEDEQLSDVEVFSEQELVIEPKSFLVFTPDAEVLLSNYPKGLSNRFIELSSFPSYPNQEGIIVVANESGEVKEVFEYNEDFHYDLLESVDGVSLERVSYDAPTSNSSNWRSAASTEGFATPGYENSQSFNRPISSGKVSAEPEVFIPGNAGSGRDFTTINYQFESPGQFANINIYDQNGRLVKNLAQGLLLSTSGFVRWDGDADGGQMARMGYYLIIFEIYDGSGNSEIIKETVVVGRDF